MLRRLPDVDDVRAQVNCKLNHCDRRRDIDRLLSVRLESLLIVLGKLSGLSPKSKPLLAEALEASTQLLEVLSVYASLYFAFDREGLESVSDLRIPARLLAPIVGCVILGRVAVSDGRPAAELLLGRAPTSLLDVFLGILQLLFCVNTSPHQLFDHLLGKV